MTKSKAPKATDDMASTAADPAGQQLVPSGPKEKAPPTEAFANIRANRDELVQAVIERTLEDGSYQAVKWLFEFGHINPANQSAPEDEPSLLRLLLEKLQIPESPEELEAEFTANGRALE